MDITQSRLAAISKIGDAAVFIERGGQQAG